MRYQLIKLPPPMGATDSNILVTFIVSKKSEIIWSYCHCRHKYLRESRMKSINDIKWGGVLNSDGTWRRASMDHGDCKDDEEKGFVINTINRSIRR
jgi:hypothetical protein